jgi:preprotein translocase subunit SecA
MGAMAETPDPLNNLLDEIPIQLVVSELESTVHRLTSESVSSRAHRRYLEDVIRGLQEQNADLRKQLTQYQDAAAAPTVG